MQATIKPTLLKTWIICLGIAPLFLLISIVPTIMFIPIQDPLSLFLVFSYLSVFLLFCTGLFLLATSHQLNFLCWRLLIYATITTFLLHFGIPKTT